jgi:YidC/Oxa1 family membrane protein insertase
MIAWQCWLAVIQHTLSFCAAELHLGMGLAIILMTLVMRSAFLPLTWTIARRAEVRRTGLQRLKPELDHLQQRFGNDRQRHAQELLKLYQRAGLTVVDGKSLFGALAQFPVFLGIYQVLRAIKDGGRFLWVANIARPDFLFAVIAGAATMALMAMTPELPEHIRLILIVVPALFTMIAALKLCAALSLYWTTTNVFSGVQNMVLRAALRRRAHTATV